MLLATLSATRIAFYATTATVLPILVLALAVQLRVRRVFGDRFGRAFEPAAGLGAVLTGGFFIFIALTTMMLALVGELFALDSLNKDRNNDPVVVAIGAK